MMKVRFKTRSSGDGTTEPAGKVYALEDDRARAYIERGLAVEIKPTEEEVAAERAVMEAAAKDAERKAKEEAKAAEKAVKEAATPSA